MHLTQFVVSEIDVQVVASTWYDARRETCCLSFSVSVHRPGSGSFFGGCLRVLYGTSSPKYVPDPLSLH